MSKKLPPGGGTIKRERGRFVALLPRSLSIPPHDCKNPDDYRERLGAFDTWDEAAGVLAAASDLRKTNPAAIRSRTFADCAALTIESIRSDAERRYGSQAQANRRVSTERSMVKLWLAKQPWWHLPIDTIETTDLQSTIDVMLRSGRTLKGAPVSVAFVRNVGRFVRAVCRDSKVSPDPSLGLVLPKKKSPKVPWWPLPSQLTFFGSDEIEEENRVMAGCGMGAGLRVGELLSLEIGDLHLGAADPHLIVRYGGPDHSPPKGGKVRRVELFEPGLGFFRIWMAEHYRETDSRLVFAGPKGGYQKHWPGNFPEWGELLRLRDATSHIMRHSYAVSLLSGTWGYEPQSLAFLKDQMGHRDQATTERYYGGYEQETWTRQVRQMTGRVARPVATEAVTAERLLGRSVGRTIAEVRSPSVERDNSRHPPHASHGSLKQLPSATPARGAHPKTVALAEQYLEAVAQQDPGAHRIGIELAQSVIEAAAEASDSDASRSGVAS